MCIYILVILFIFCYRRFTNFVVFFFTVTFHEGLCPIQLEMTTKPMKVIDRSGLEHHSDSKEWRIGLLSYYAKFLMHFFFFFFSSCHSLFIFSYSYFYKISYEKKTIQRAFKWNVALSALKPKWIWDQIKLIKPSPKRNHLWYCHLSSSMISCLGIQLSSFIFSFYLDCFFIYL